eukprot:jgi/Chlat1/5426/Chrsp35S05231
MESKRAAEGAMQGNPVEGYAGVVNFEEHPGQTTDVVIKGETKQYSRNPVVHFVQWVLSFVIPGMGMFSEAYFIFAVGNLTNIWKSEYPECWVTHAVCRKNLSDVIQYSQIAGIIVGMLIISFFADRLGRKLGSVLTASIMLVGAGLMTGAAGRSTSGLFIMFLVAQIWFGFGVGGEYPIASSSAAERAEADSRLVQRRGETVVCVFSMQGWGNFVNTLNVVWLLAAFGENGAPYNPGHLNAVWRISLGLGIFPIIFMLGWRIFVLKESAVWKAKRQSLEKSGVGVRFDNRKLLLVFKHYGPRLVGTSLSWFVWDFAFYGNKLFQSTFIKIINPGAGVREVALWTLLNSGVALVGYYFAAFTIDKTWMGRRRMQNMGFVWMFVLFTICAAAYHHLLKPGSPIHWFQFMYYFSSFWGQWGPNATTWLLAGELYPTEVRAMCHGISAAWGKLGALVSGIIFAHVSDRAKFWASGVCGLVGIVVTTLFIPDYTGLDLREADKLWLYRAENRSDRYHGEAINPRHLSLFERLVFRTGAGYNPELAAKAHDSQGYGTYANTKSGKELTNVSKTDVA